jgi:histidine triad (HIT) family protein
MSDCLFCAIAAGDIPATIVHSDDDVVAFRDIDPQAPTHILVIPRVHYANARELGESDAALAGRLMAVAGELAESEGVAADGYRIVTNTGAGAGQSVDHVHFHLLGGRPLTWPPG